MGGWELAGVTLAGSVSVVALGVVLFLYERQHRGTPVRRKPPSAGHDQPPSAVAKFARDVGVNVIANLVAAAVVYIAAVVGGLLPRSPYLIVASAVVVLVSIGMALGALGLVVRNHVGLYFLGIALIAMGVGALTFPFFGDLLIADPVERWLSPLGGVGAITVGVSAIVNVRRQRRQAQDGRVSGDPVKARTAAPDEPDGAGV
ncbi:hypothetical protein M8C11_18805 [Micromonospora sp. CPM1]|uniref:hypothetical protein n=1 Tax=Micromonospora sp. CPM1 TaxID=2944809 RepID=UPI00207C8721|nr:hypothetical protein [Micromonospora sp. CPM1]MCO1616767.1 hypothetical protein [Micromonospora sp. CPM1]